jgi:hypothetical protein
VARTFTTRQGIIRTLSKRQVTNPDFGQIGHALRDASKNRSQAIRNIHLDLMRTNTGEATRPPAGAAKRQMSPNLSVVDATMTSLSAIADVASSIKREGSDRDFEHAAESHPQIDDESRSKHHDYSFTSLMFLRRTSVPVAANGIPSQITITKSSKEKMEWALTDDCSLLDEEIINLFQTESSPSSSCSDLDEIIDMDADELNKDLEAAMQLR